MAIQKDPGQKGVNWSNIAVGTSIPVQSRARSYSSSNRCDHEHGIVHCLGNKSMLTLTTSSCRRDYQFVSGLFRCSPFQSLTRLSAVPGGKSALRGQCLCM